MDVKVGVKVSFMIPDGCTEESECSEIMHRAFEACRQNLMDVQWISNSKILNLDQLQKNNFIVFQSFEGETFEKIKSSKSVIIGPWCLLYCLSEGISIPNLSWPIFNMAMAGCCVTSSHLPKAMKEAIKHKVGSMGGVYTDSIYETNTHLVTDSVKSEKYLKAATSGMKIMLPTWVSAVWNASLNCNINCNDEEFEKYRCLPFQNLRICTTGFTIVEERKKIQSLIEENGGTYSGQMHITKTDILVCEGTHMSEKLKQAKKTKNIKCVTYAWITDSIQKGYALPETDYMVQRGTSTPTKDDDFLNPNFSTISAISNATHMSIARSILQETVNTTNIPNETNGKKRKSGSLDELIDMVEKIDLKRVKRAGSFLDGCSIYLVGFENEQREKICKILNFGGATRYEGISDRVTHIIVGDTSCHELKLIQSKSFQIPIVNINWLNECVEQERIVPEEKYLVTASSKDCGSPLSKKGLQLLCNNTSSLIPNNLEQENIPAVEADINSDIMMHYLKPSVTQEDTLALLLKDGTNPFDTKSNSKQNNVTSNITTKCSITESQEDTTQIDLIFQGLKFIIVNYDDEEELELKANIEAVAGEVVAKSYKGIPDYLIIPTFNSQEAPPASETVTDIWIMDCCRDNKLKAVEYYHKPFKVQRNDVLKDCVVTISTYTGTERIFLKQLIEELGGTSQEQFSRIRKNNMLASTHLLTPEASGAKYQAALKWGRPVVNKDWLFECAKLGKLVSEAKFLIGEAKAPERSEEDDPSQSTISVTNEESSSVTICEERQLKETALVREFNMSTYSLNKTIGAAVNLNDTPTTSRNTREESRTEDATPKRTSILNNDGSPNACSQVTPVNKIMNQIRSNYMLGTPPSTPPLPKRWGDVDTPDTPLGAFIRPNPSPHLRKEMLKWINTFPERTRRNSTPLSELKKQLWDKICPPKDSQSQVAERLGFNESLIDDLETRKLNTSTTVENENINALKTKDTPETPENIMIQSKLLQLNEMLSSSGGSRKSWKKRESGAAIDAVLKNSQACTVEWDYAECHADSESNKRVPHFMLSGINMEEREDFIRKLQSLGATVSELNNYDPDSTHLISNRPSRNEKMLSCMAAGKWVLHPDYVKKSLELGKLADEEEYEYGNPKFLKDINIQLDRETEIRVNAIHWWRKEITKRGYGAFHDMRAIVVAHKKEPIVRVIQAGGGMVIDVSPPFTKEIYATHCLLDPKLGVDMTEYTPLAEQGIYIFSTIYINDFLHRSLKDVKECILPAFLKYYD